MFGPIAYATTHARREQRREKSLERYRARKSAKIFDCHAPRARKSDPVNTDHPDFRQKKE